MIFIKYILFMSICTVSLCKIHNFEIKNNTSKYVALSSFGFYTGGKLEVRLINFRATPENPQAVFGFSLIRTTDDRIDSYKKIFENSCILEDRPIKIYYEDIIISFTLDFIHGQLRVVCTEPFRIYKNNREATTKSKIPASPYCNNLNLDIKPDVKDGHTFYNTSFVSAVDNVQKEGLYYLFFHSCPNSNADSKTFVDFTVEIAEQNPDSYLSAGEMPLPALYCTMSILFLLSGILWLLLLRRSRYPILRIHHMMSCLVFLKATSLAFHGINYHYLERLGRPLAMWGILFHIMHFLEELLLTIVLVLISTGWNVFRHKLTPRDKWFLWLIIPIQVLPKIATIIIEENGLEPHNYSDWRLIKTITNALYCILILFPTVWSIRYFKKVVEIDVKAAVDLRRYRWFYVMLVFYIYMTYIMGYLLIITLSFQYGWLREMCSELVSYILFVFVAFKFQPTSWESYSNLINK